MSASQLTTEKTEYHYGSILIDCLSFRDTIVTEVKQGISVYGQAIQNKYKRDMAFIVAQATHLPYVYTAQLCLDLSVAFSQHLQVPDFDHKLEHQI